jgi:flagellar hook-basal body complex protein FliE
MAIESLTPSIGRATTIGRKPSAVAETGESGGASSFADSLAGLLQSVDESAGKANDAVSNMLTGTGDVHEAMIALQRAETTLHLTVQVRNKLVQAYQDVMRMPI